MKNYKPDYYVHHYVEDKDQYRLHYVMFCKNLGMKILDVGCSTGNFLMHCSKESCGVDGDYLSVQKAKERGLNAELINLDEQDLPFKDDEFDAVNFISTIEHLKNPLKCLSEIKRVLKPDGKLIIRAKNLKWWKFNYWNNYNQFTMITPESMRQFLLTAGFNNFKINYIDRGTPAGLKMLDYGISVNLIRKWAMLWGALRKKYVFAEAIKNSV